MTERDAEIDAFLADHGWAGAARRPLAGDASFRRYERISQGERRAVLMDAPSGQEDVRPFMAVDAYLIGRGLSAPKIFAADEAAGLLLLEDLGDGRYTELIDTGARIETEALFEAAVDVLIDLHGAPLDGLDVPVLDGDRLCGQVEIFLDMYVPAVTGAAASDAQRADFLKAWRAALPLVRAVPTGLVLYDYHAPNLMWLPERRGVKRVGLLDFQDAMIGPIAFDLVSLLENPRQDIDPPLAEAMTARYLAARPAIDTETFAAACAVLGAQRSTRNLGNFVRLWRGGKPAYLDHIPRLWRTVEKNLRHPALAPLAAWFDAVIPPDMRRKPE